MCVYNRFGEHPAGAEIDDQPLALECLEFGNERTGHLIVGFLKQSLGITPLFGFAQFLLGGFGIDEARADRTRDICHAADNNDMRKRVTTIAPIAVVVIALVAVGFVLWPRSGSAYSATRSDFSLQQLDGNGTVSLRDYRGKPVVVDLFASWCTACQDELPILAAASHQYAGQITFVGVDSEDPGNGLAMAQRLGIGGWPLARDAGPTQSQYHDSLGAPSMPVAAFYDSNGTLVTIDTYALTADELQAKLAAEFHIHR
jgi:thiol-disulfide isomerase/thioredoxin